MGEAEDIFWVRDAISKGYTREQVKAFLASNNTGFFRRRKLLKMFDVVKGGEETMVNNSKVAKVMPVRYADEEENLDEVEEEVEEMPKKVVKKVTPVEPEEDEEEQEEEEKTSVSPTNALSEAILNHENRLRSLEAWAFRIKNT